ncbi:MAG TPA: hypothetical protein VK709_15935 [Candidatus Saccharimonadales bacterium]|nr:hypothetical protein [Candidatus Saccharimonadales bacterium]
MQRSRKTFFVSAGVAVAAISVVLASYGIFRHSATAHASPVPDIFAALPAGAPTLAYVDLGAIRASSFYQHRPDKGPIALPSQDYADFVRSTGFDFEKDLERVVIASWPPDSPNAPRKSVAIAEGHFDRAKIRDYATRKGKVDHQQGHEVFLFPAGDSKTMNSITFLDDRRIALVAGSSIAPLLASHMDAAGGDPVRDRAAHLDGAAAFLITHVPPIPDNAAGAGPQAAGAAQFLTLARSVQWVTFAARPEGDNLRVSLEGECDNATDAVQVKTALELMRMFGRAGLDSAKNKQSMDPAVLAMLQTLLTGAEVTQAAERVRILVEVTPDVWHLGGPAKAQQ